MVDTKDADNSNSEAAYAGWSLVIIYTVPDMTSYHLLRLYDDFIFSSQDKVNGVNVDFDQDGQPGGTVSGFYIPEPPRDQYGNLKDPNAAKITAFVGEGDQWYSGDYIAIKRPDGSRATKLWDGRRFAAPVLCQPATRENRTLRPTRKTSGMGIQLMPILPWESILITLQFLGQSG